MENYFLSVSEGRDTVKLCFSNKFRVKDVSKSRAPKLATTGH